MFLQKKYVLLVSFYMDILTKKIPTFIYFVCVSIFGVEFFQYFKFTYNGTVFRGTSENGVNVLGRLLLKQ